MTRFFILAFLITAACAQKSIRPANGEISRLLKEADTDHDQKITVHDRPTVFHLRCNCGKEIEISGAYPLSNLLQELKLKEIEGRREIEIARVFENPVDRISRSIRERYWDNLTRRVDLSHLAQALEDPKLPKRDWRYLYVPAQDQAALAYFRQAENIPALRVKVVALSDPRTIGDRHGLLSLALDGERGVPFVVPGGRFNEMYGWDSYFEALGLIVDGRVDLAKAMADNFIYQIEYYGKILNANRSYYLNRSQPPFLTSMILAIESAQPQSPAWRDRAIRAAIKEYNEVWNSPARQTATGLNRYFGDDFGIPPEVEPGHFDYFFKPLARRHGLSVEKMRQLYNDGQLRDEVLKDFLAHDRAVRESGHDTTYRWKVGARDRAADFVTVDLNSLLYKYETDLAQLTGDAQWLTRAQKRKDLMMRYLWDEQRRMFFDYDWRRKRRSAFVAATGFYPLWAGLVERTQAEPVVAALLKHLEAPGGLLATDEASLKEVGAGSIPRQWDYPNGWPPHQMMAWQGLKNYGFDKTMHRLIYKWLYMITKNAADFNGTVPEKFDVIRRSHAVFAEYGNVGTDFSYITQEGFGWMNASYQVGLRELPEAMRAELRKLTPPAK